MRDARREASERVGGRLDVRVLEPSPPAVHEAPSYADDPVVGGDLVPVDRPGAQSWAAYCEEAGDPDLLRWCQDRWLVRAPLLPLPATFTATRQSLHALAEHVIVPSRFAANGKIGLRFTYRGFGTPLFGADRQVRVEDGVLLDGDERHVVTTLGDAARFLGVPVGAPPGVYTPTTAGDPDAALVVDPAAGRAIGDWFGFAASLLEQLRAEAGPDDDPSRLQLWPEHFDIAITLGAAGSRANFGGSPGDAEHPSPYLYVGPFEPATGPFWNEPFGASLSYDDMLAGADPLAFLREGRDRLRAHP